MTINEEKIEVENFQEIITDDDKNVLISLLNEYTGKLVKLCDELEKNSFFVEISSLSLTFYSSRLKNKKQKSIDKTGYIFSIVVSFIGWIVFTNYLIDSRIALNSSNNIFYKIVMISLGLIVFSFFLNFISSHIAKVNILKREINRVATRLEKVVRITSQVQNNLDFNLVARVELDLRIADAESALDYYQEIINQ